MKRLLAKWFGIALCEHRWDVTETWEILSGTNDDKIGKMYVMRCSKCGDMKSTRVTVQ